MGQHKQPPSIVIVAVLAVAKAALRRVRHHDPPTQQRPALERQSSKSLARQLTQEEMEPLHEAVSRIGSRRMAQDDDRELPPLPGEAPQTLVQRAWNRLQASGALHVRLPSRTLLAWSAKLIAELLVLILAGLHGQWLMLAFCALALLLECTQASFIFRTAQPLLHRDGSEEGVAIHPSTPEQQEEEEGGAPALPAPQSHSPATANPLLNGTWHKVDALSESQDAAAKLLKLGGLARSAMRMFKGMEFVVTDTHLSSTALTKLPFIKVAKETYALDGSVSFYPRRDMRKGKFVGYVKVTQDGGINLYYRFEEPLAGHCCDEIRLIGPDEMHITTQLSVDAGSCAYRVVYYRQGSALALRTCPSSASLAPIAAPTAAPTAAPIDAGDAKALGRAGSRRSSDSGRSVKAPCPASPAPKAASSGRPPLAGGHLYGPGAAGRSALSGGHSVLASQPSSSGVSSVSEDLPTPGSAAGAGAGAARGSLEESPGAGGLLGGMAALAAGAAGRRPRSSQGHHHGPRGGLTLDALGDTSCSGAGATRAGGFADSSSCSGAETDTRTHRGGGGGGGLASGYASSVASTPHHHGHHHLLNTQPHHTSPARSHMEFASRRHRRHDDLGRCSFDGPPCTPPRPPLAPPMARASLDEVRSAAAAAVAAGRHAPSHLAPLRTSAPVPAPAAATGPGTGVGSPQRFPQVQACVSPFAQVPPNREAAF